MKIVKIADMVLLIARFRSVVNRVFAVGTVASFF